MSDYTFITDAARIDEGKKLLEDYLAHVDQEKVAEVMKEQIDVVGGQRSVYEIVDENLRNGLIEFSLLKESCDLYRWRRNYFDENLPVLKGSWFTNSWCRDTITCQITKNFQQVVDICCSHLRPNGSHPRGLYFEVSAAEESSKSERFRIDNLEILYHVVDKYFWKHYFLTEKYLPGSYLRYGDVARILFEHYQNSPHRLEELAMMKTKRKDRISKENISKQVVRNDEYGFFEPENFQKDLEKFSKDGQELFSQLKMAYDQIRAMPEPDS